MRRLLTIPLLCLCLTASAQRSAWMAQLPDDMPACRVSIPGTHDSGTAGVRFPTRHYARTQTLTLAEQWDAGIRFFDLRPKPDGDRLAIYHGPANCHLTFSEALLILIGKLQAHPTEFCIVMTNLAGGDRQAMRMVNEEIRQTVPDSMTARFTSDLKTGSLRGRILFLHRSGKAIGAYFAGPNRSGPEFRIIEASDSDESAPVLWQDYYYGSDDYLERKWQLMSANLLKNSGMDDSTGIWCINHASGYTGHGISTNIRRNATATNARLLQQLLQHPAPTGIIPMDFPSQDLIDAIIACNPAYAEAPQALHCRSDGLYWPCRHQAAAVLQSFPFPKRCLSIRYPQAWRECHRQARQFQS